MDYPRITWQPGIDVGVGAIASKIALINLGGLLPGEIILSGNGKEAPVDHCYIGLFARARLYADVAESCIVQSINM